MRVLRDWLLTPQRVAVHLPTQTAVLSDLHLGYAEARCGAGDAVPSLRLELSLEPLVELLRHRERAAPCAGSSELPSPPRRGRDGVTHFGGVSPAGSRKPQNSEAKPIRRLIVAGDLFEERWCDHSVTGLRVMLAGMGVDRVEIIPGNHDRAVPAGVDGVEIKREGSKVGRWRVIHGHQRLPSGKIVLGHFHPRLTWRGVAVACFLVGASQIVLPAFSQDAAGVNVLGNARWDGYRCLAIAGHQVLDLGDVAELARRRRRKPLHQSKKGTRR